MMRITKKHINHLSYEIIGAAITVHKAIGPGLLEKVYEACMIHELKLRGIKTIKQQTVPINYKGVVVDAELRFDLLVDDLIVVELKSVKELLPIFDAQAISYAKLLEIPKAILIYFNCVNIFKNGQKTFISESFRHLPEE